MYYLISAIVPVVLFTLIGATQLSNVSPSHKCESCLNITVNPSDITIMVGTMFTGPGNLLLALALSCYMLIAFLSLFYAYRRLERPGVSKEVRSMFLKKHFLYVFVFIGIWTIQLSQNYY